MQPLRQLGTDIVSENGRTRLRKSALVANLRYLSLQIPDIVLNLGTPQQQKEQAESLKCDPNFGIGETDVMLDLPDDYFMRCGGSQGGLAVGKEAGFLYLSPRGYAAVKPMLKEAFAGQEARPGVAFRPRGSWRQFELTVAEFFKGIERNSRERIGKLRVKASNVQNAVDNVFGP
jgi:hypothetical protein